MTALTTWPAVPADVMARVHEWTSVRRRPGRRFEPIAERELDIVLRTLAARLPGAVNGISVITQMPGPYGLPDLVAVPLTPRLEARLNHACPPLISWPDARLVASVPIRRTISLPALCHRLQVEDSAIRRRLTRLVNAGALALAANGGLLRTDELQPVGRLYALEAKVEDWSAGLGQALRYGTWADASAAVVSRLPKDPSRAIAQATDLGLGLALGDRWLVRPRLRRLQVARRLWASEHVVAALVGATRIMPVAEPDR